MRVSILTSLLTLLYISPICRAVSAAIIPPLNQEPITSDPFESDSPKMSNGDLLTISDVLPKTRSINVFASLTRDVSTVAGRLESTNPADNTTLLAPLNSAMQALPRKPWEDRPGDTSNIHASSNEEKAVQNIEKFVEAHVIPVSPWVEGKDGKIKTLGGVELWWESNQDGKRVVMPQGLVVDGIVGRVGNGEVWALKGVINYE